MGRTRNGVVPRAIVVVSAAVLVLIGCSNDDTSTDADATTEQEPATGDPEAAAEDHEATAEAAGAEWDGPTIPLGTYRKVMSGDEALADLRAVGVSESTATHLIVHDIDSEEIQIAFQIDDGLWFQFMTWSGVHDDLGSRGTYTYTDDGQWAIVEDPCPDESCEDGPPLTWTFADDVLTLNPDTDWAEVLDIFREQDEEWIFASVFLIFSGEYEKVE